MTARATRVRKIRVVLDDRTSAMPDEVLECRGFNHNWVRQPVAPHKAIEMARDGYKLIIRVCRERQDGTGGCGNTWTQTFSRHDGSLVEEQRDYDKGYLVPPGTGRMGKAEARKALWAREDAQFYH